MNRIRILLGSALAGAATALVATTAFAQGSAEVMEPSAEIARASRRRAQRDAGRRASRVGQVGGRAQGRDRPHPADQLSRRERRAGRHRRRPRRGARRHPRRRGPDDRRRRGRGDRAVDHVEAVRRLDLRHQRRPGAREAGRRDRLHVRRDDDHDDPGQPARGRLDGGPLRQAGRRSGRHLPGAPGRGGFGEMRDADGNHVAAEDARRAAGGPDRPGGRHGQRLRHQRLHDREPGRERQGARGAARHPARRRLSRHADRQGQSRAARHARGGAASRWSTPAATRRSWRNGASARSRSRPSRSTTPPACRWSEADGPHRHPPRPVGTSCRPSEPGFSGGRSPPEPPRSS